MDAFTRAEAQPSFKMKLWRGERMCLVAFDVGAPEPDFVGFAIECKPPGAKRFTPLMNRLAFSYDRPVGAAVTGDKVYSSKQAPFQKFRWVHFPFEPRPGLYAYRGTKLMIEDQRIATAYAIEALRVFDHLHFRSKMQDASTAPPSVRKTALTLRKPRAITGKPAWFESSYVADSQKMRDRQLFAS